MDSSLPMTLDKHGVTYKKRSNKALKYSNFGLNLRYTAENILFNLQPPPYQGVENPR